MTDIKFLEVIHRLMNNQYSYGYTATEGMNPPRSVRGWEEKLIEIIYEKLPIPHLHRIISEYMSSFVPNFIHKILCFNMTSGIVITTNKSYRHTIPEERHKYICMNVILEFHSHLELQVSYHVRYGETTGQYISIYLNRLGTSLFLTYMNIFYRADFMPRGILYIDDPLNPKSHIARSLFKINDILSVYYNMDEYDVIPKNHGTRVLMESLFSTEEIKTKFIVADLEMYDMLEKSLLYQPHIPQKYNINFITPPIVEDGTDYNKYAKLYNGSDLQLFCDLLSIKPRESVDPVDLPVNQV